MQYKSKFVLFKHKVGISKTFLTRDSLLWTAPEALGKNICSSSS